jgi:hypothetical protein
MQTHKHKPCHEVSSGGKLQHQTCVMCQQEYPKQSTTQSLWCNTLAHQHALSGRHLVQHPGAPTCSQWPAPGATPWRTNMLSVAGTWCNTLAHLPCSQWPAPGATPWRTCHALSGRHLVQHPGAPAMLSVASSWCNTLAHQHALSAGTKQQLQSACAGSCALPNACHTI